MLGTTIRSTFIALMSAPLIAAAGPSEGITMQPWGEVDGKPVHLWTLNNGHGMTAQITDYGTILVSLQVPDATGKTADVVLGRPTVADYVARTQYFGCTAGRCANRIAAGEFTIDGTKSTLARNNGANHLHGGVKGFDKVVWQCAGLSTVGGPSVKFSYHSPDGEEGYPGAVDATVTYRLTPANELMVDMSATSDKPTPINLVHHSYWNLAGHGAGTVLDHTLRIPASRYTPTDATLITTGEIVPVAGTPLDFTIAKAIGRDIGKLPASGDDPGGFDHNLVLDQAPKGADGLWLSAVLADPASGRTMEIWSNQPGIQFYSGNFLDGVPGKDGAVYDKLDGCSLETQAFPDSVNKQGKAGWPDVVLRPGQKYEHHMVHKFTAAAPAPTTQK